MAILVFDSTPLSCFARARQLQMLERLTEGDDRVTTRAVLDEIRDGVRDHPELQDVIELTWLRVESTDSLEELRFFARYAARLGSDVHDVGEASVLAWAEAHDAIALTDDEAAVSAGRARGVEVRRTLALVARGVRVRTLSEGAGDRLVDELLRAGGRFPFGAGEFMNWARGQGLL